MPAVTVSMPTGALAFADAEAKSASISRSAWLTRLVLTAELAAEGRADEPLPVVQQRQMVEQSERVKCPACDNLVPPAWIGKPHKVAGKACGVPVEVEA